jgi:putative alpha-1,2-mannosidase
MNYKKLAVALLLLPVLLAACRQNNPTECLQLVDPFIGTGADGNTWPAASMPFGGVQLGPDTRLNSCGGYASADSIIQGFTHTHLNGVGEPEYRDVLMMPFTGETYLNPMEPEKPGYGSSFDHQHEKASPGYYSVLLKKYGIKTELTATTRGGFQRYTFPNGEKGHILFDLQVPEEDKSTILEAGIKKVNDTEIEGFVKCVSGWNKYTLHFVARFNRSFSSMGGWQGEQIINEATELKEEIGI